MQVTCDYCQATFSEIDATEIVEDGETTILCDVCIDYYDEEEGEIETEYYSN